MYIWTKRAIPTMTKTNSMWMASMPAARTKTQTTVQEIYQALIGISIDEIDTDGDPSGKEADITVVYTLKTNHEGGIHTGMKTSTTW